MDNQDLNAANSRRWLKRLSAALLFWTAVVLFYSTQGFAAKGVYDTKALLNWACFWYSWGLISALIIWLDRRLPVKRENLVRRALLHLPLSILVTTLWMYLYQTASLSLRGMPLAPLFTPKTLREFFNGMLHWTVPTYWVIFGAWRAREYYRGFRERELQNAKLKNLLAEAQINVLRSQLDPHFLFNALNAISAHLENSPRMARRMLEHLGDLLRLSLEHRDRQEVSLEEEIEFLNHYLEIQKVRFEDRLRISLHIAPETLPAAVPPLILQPLVENAIRHGVGRRAAGGTVEVSSWRERDTLHLEVRDDGPGLAPGWNAGLGLTNTRDRLQHLYPEIGALDIRDASPGVRVSLRLLWRATMPEAFMEPHAEPVGAGR